MGKLTFFVDNKLIDIDYEETNNKNMYLKVKNDKVVVFVPKKIPEHIVKEFVSKNIEKMNKFLNHKKNKVYLDYSKKWFFLFGKKIFFENICGFTNIKMNKIGSKYYLQLINDDIEEVKNAIDSFLKLELEKYISVSLPQWEEKMKTYSHTFKITDKETSWGTNFLKKKHITFSSKLVHFSKKVIDYVIVHELSHVKNPDHSKSFWNYVQQFASDYNETKKILEIENEIE